MKNPVAKLVKELLYEVMDSPLINYDDPTVLESIHHLVRAAHPDDSRERFELHQEINAAALDCRPTAYGLFRKDDRMPVLKPSRADDFSGLQGWIIGTGPAKKVRTTAHLLNVDEGFFFHNHDHFGRAYMTLVQSEDDFFILRSSCSSANHWSARVTRVLKFDNGNMHVDVEFVQRDDLHKLIFDAPADDGSGHDIMPVFYNGRWQESFPTTFETWEASKTDPSRSGVEEYEDDFFAQFMEKGVEDSILASLKRDEEPTVEDE